MSFRKSEYLISVVSKISIVIVSFIVSIIVNRYLGPAIKGEYAYIVNIVGILSLILNFGIGQSYSYFLRTEGNGIKQKFVILFYIQLFIYLLVFGSFLFFSPNRNLTFILILSIISVFEAQLNFMAMISNINKTNIYRLIIAVAHLVMLLALYLLSDSNLYLLLLLMMAKSIINISLLIFKFELYPTSLKIDPSLVRRILTFSFIPMVTSIMITLNYSVDIIVLERFVSYYDIGLYSLGVTLAGMLWIIPDAFKDVLFNKTAKSNSIDEIVFSIKFNLYLSLMSIICFIVLGKPFILIFYGTEFVESYPVLVILLFGAIPMILFKLINTLYISIGNQKFTLKVLTASVALNVILNLIIIPYYGILGAAISSVLSYMLCGIIFFYSFTKKFQIKTSSMLVISRSEIMKIKNLVRKSGSKL